MASPTTHEPALRAAVKDAMRVAGLGPVELAHAMNTHPHALRRHLDGEGRFPVSVLVDIAAALRLKPSSLMARAESP